MAPESNAARGDVCRGQQEGCSLRVYPATTSELQHQHHHHHRQRRPQRSFAADHLRTNIHVLHIRRKFYCRTHDHKMRSSITAASLLASGAAAFSDSSPFLMLSTSKYGLFLSPYCAGINLLLTHFCSLGTTSSNDQLQTTSSVLANAHSLLASCPTQTYNIITHPNAHASDLRHPITGVCQAKSLCANNSTRIQTTFGVAEVAGEVIDAQALRAYIEEACGKAGREAVVSVSQLDTLPGRAEASRGNVMAMAGRF